MTPYSLQELIELEARATKGHWSFLESERGSWNDSRSFYKVLSKIPGKIVAETILEDPREEDAQFIAAIRNAAPQLLAEIVRLQSMRDEFKRFISTMEAINVHQGHPFTQVILNTKQTIAKIEAMNKEPTP